ncbi:MAG TPA: hypothetical protein VFB85_16935 [Vicinamibacterales bacterium]|nr:hypothetical protein [Vicinamibacterales bacterium]
MSRELGMLLPGASILACAQSGRTAIVAVMVVMRVVEDGEHLCGSAYLKWMLICKPQLLLLVQGGIATPDSRSGRKTYAGPALTRYSASVTLLTMRYRRLSWAIALFLPCVIAGGCRQPDGAWPQDGGEVTNRLSDLQRDLQNVAAGDGEGAKDLADDLAVFAATPEGTAAARTLAGSVSVAVAKRSLNEDALKQLSSNLWKTVASRELSERQVDALKDDMRGTLTSIGVAQSDANAVADRVAQTQKAVSNRTRRWYERY